MNIYQQIDNIFGDSVAEVPDWASEMLKEMQEIKKMLTDLSQTYVRQSRHRADDRNRSGDGGMYEFVKRFRRKLRADVDKGVYPTFEYHGRSLGVDFKGLLYDKETSHLLSRSEAMNVYRYAYEQELQSRDFA